MRPPDRYIEELQEPFRSIAVELKYIIDRAIPEAELLFKYGIPFYYVKGKPFCYINVRNKLVDLGFSRGRELVNFQAVMCAEKRKMVRSLQYHNLEDIDEGLLRLVLMEALALYS